MKRLIVVLTILGLGLIGCGQSNAGQQVTISDIRGGDLTSYIHNIFTGEGAWLAIKPDGSGTMWWAESYGTPSCAAYRQCVGGAAITAGVLSSRRLHITLDRVWFTTIDSYVDPANLRKAPNPGQIPIANGYSSSNLSKAETAPSNFKPRAEGPKAGDWIEFTVTLPSPDDVVDRGPVLHDVAHNRSVVFGVYLDGTLERLGGDSDTDWPAMQGLDVNQPDTPA